MKKNFVILLLITIFVFSHQAKAVSYRGFVEGVWGGVIYNKTFAVSKSHLESNAGFSTTHGIQILNNLFVGIGMGYNWIWLPYIDLYDHHYQYYQEEARAKHLNFHTDVRWDGFGLFGKAKRVSPFVDLKIGYQTARGGAIFDDIILDNISSNKCDIIWYEDPDHLIHAHDCNTGMLGGWLVRPTIGVRFGLSKRVGINLGLYFDLANSIRLKKGKYEGWYNESIREGSGWTWERKDRTIEIKNTKTCNLHPFGLSIGIDF